MEIIANLIKTKFPNYKKWANDAYASSYNKQWEKQMYKGNPTFENLKQMYNVKNNDLTRDMIIKLFEEKKYFEGFLCAMVWGNMGTYFGGKKRFDGVFNAAKQDEITSIINNVITLLQDDKLEEAYLSLCYKGENRIVGVGEAFFTKLLYFAGAAIDSEKLTIKPLIFDSKMHGIYNHILAQLGLPKKRQSAVKRYIDYCHKMEKLRALLNLPSSGHVEAFLFKNGI